MKDGSRHERAAIVATAYVIGFITAFIGYGVSDLSGFPTDQDNGTGQTAAVIQANEVPVQLVEKEDGLFLLKGKEEVLLSAHSAGGLVGEGVYAVLPAYELSPDERFVYFCEQPTMEATSCAPYVYSVAEAIVYPVTRAGERIGLPAEEHSVEWSKQGVIALDGMTVDEQN